MAKIFVSHRTADVDDARRLAQDLRAFGHEVWLDEWAISVGDSIVAEINSGLEPIRYLVLCYSDVGVDSPWMSREWMSTLARQLNGANVKILPVRFAGGTPPALLEDIKYVDLSADWTDGVRQLRAALI